MKSLFYILFFIISASCSCQKNTNSFNLTKTEKNIINEFLEYELGSDVYKYRKNNKIVIIENAISRKHVLEDYLSLIRNYNESKIDSLQVVEIKKNLEKESFFYWKTSDIKINNILIQNSEDFRKSIKKEEYLYLPPRIIFHLSVPLIINDKEAIISFMSGGGDLGYTAINNGLVLMVKNEENIWVFKQFLGSNSS